MMLLNAFGNIIFVVLIGFQKLIGYADVKSATIFFNVNRNKKNYEIGSPISFESALVNRGEAMDVTTGIFTADRAGTYFFFFSGVGTLPAKSSASQFFEIVLYLNDFTAISSDSFVGGVIAEDWNGIITIQTIVDLQPNDYIYLMLSFKTNDAYLSYVNHFIGWMLEEKIAATNN